jgi:hypothetical protein
VVGDSGHGAEAGGHANWTGRHGRSKGYDHAHNAVSARFLIGGGQRLAGVVARGARHPYADHKGTHGETCHDRQEARVGVSAEALERLGLVGARRPVFLHQVVGVVPAPQVVHVIDGGPARLTHPIRVQHGVSRRRARGQGEPSAGPEGPLVGRLRDVRQWHGSVFPCEGVQGGQDRHRGHEEERE